MTRKNIALVLGGTVPHISLIKNLKERGFYTILVDYLSNPPAKSFADSHLLASTLDKEVVLKIAREENASLVISACIDQANSTCCWVSEQLGLPHPYSYETSLLVTDKSLMKPRMKEAGIPTSDFKIVSSINDLILSTIKYPCVTKPVDCNSSKGVHRSENSIKVKKNIEEALKLSRKGQAIIEDFVEGEEIQVDCIATNYDTLVVMTRKKVKVRDIEGAVLQSWGSIIPANLSIEQQKQINIIAKKIAKSFNLKNTPFFFQAIANENTISVLEFAPRIGGGLSHYMLKTFIGYDAVNAVVDSFLHEPIQCQIYALEKKYRTCLLYSKSCVFDHVEGLDILKNDCIIDDYFITKNRFDIIDGDLRSSNRIGSFIVSGKTDNEIDNKVTKAYITIKVIDDKGNNKLRTPFS